MNIPTQPVPGAPNVTPLHAARAEPRSLRSIIIFAEGDLRRVYDLALIVDDYMTSLDQITIDRQGALGILTSQLVDTGAKLRNVCDELLELAGLGGESMSALATEARSYFARGIPQEAIELAESDRALATIGDFVPVIASGFYSCLNARSLDRAKPGPDITVDDYVIGLQMLGHQFLLSVDVDGNYLCHHSIPIGLPDERPESWVGRATHLMAAWDLSRNREIVTYLLEWGEVIDPMIELARRWKEADVIYDSGIGDDDDANDALLAELISPVLAEMVEDCPTPTTAAGAIAALRLATASCSAVGDDADASRSLAVAALAYLEGRAA